MNQGEIMLDVGLFRHVVGKKFHPMLLTQALEVSKR